jgi:hypothetical protein
MADLREAAGDQAAQPMAEHLVNLTEHKIVLHAQLHTADGNEPGLATPSVVRIPPDGRLARVDDEQARLDEDWLRAASEKVRLTKLRRSGKTVGLPVAQPGTRYVVSRLTALAARGRRDLVFPLAEIRDGDGHVVAAQGLGTYRRKWATAERFRDRRALARARRSHHGPEPRIWLTGVLFATGTALLSGALGLLPGVLDNAEKNGWAGGGQPWTSWLTVGFFLLGSAVLLLAVRRWLVRMRVLGERGTAYVIEEQAIHWRHEEKTSVLATIRDGFASVLMVPGPEALGDNWRWEADADGAPQWDARADQLVRSFWAVHYNDDHVTRNAVFVWAPWPVAMAFGARATARRRGLVLHVRQRPSDGAGGSRRELRLEDGAHDFLRARKRPPLAAEAPRHSLTQASGYATVTIRSLPGPGARTGGLDRQADGGLPRPRGRRPAASSREPAPLLLLLVRLVARQIGPIPLDLRQIPEISLAVCGRLAASEITPGRHHVPVAEWRLSADDGDQVPWRAFPAVAETIADWVEQQAAAHPSHVILLATRMPQEVAVGLGIQLGQRSSTWPHRVYPVHYAERQLVVPDLDLGRDSVPAERQ